MPYLIDTNIFWDILQEWNGNIPKNYTNLLTDNSVITFAIPEICTMEIWSVLGKYIRGKNKQSNICNRIIVFNAGEEQCTNTWITQIIPKISNRQAQQIIKLIKDILANNIPDFNITIISISTVILQNSAILLQKYAPLYDFHSLDAIIASCSTGMTVLTADRVLKNVLREENINFL